MGKGEFLEELPLSDVQSVQLTGRKVAFKQVKQSNIPLNIAANAQTQIQIVPTAKTIARLRYVGFYAPGIAAATTGSQVLSVSIGTDSSYSVYCPINKSSTTTGSASAANSDNAYAVPGLLFNSDNPLTITLANFTNALQNGSAAYTVVWEEEAII